MREGRKGRRPSWKKGFVAGIYVLSAADVQAGAIRLAKARFLYDAKAVGDKDGPAEATLSVEFVPGGTTEGTLSGKGKVLGEPNPATRAFLEAIGATAGDRLLVERTGERQIRVSKAD